MENLLRLQLVDHPLIRPSSIHSPDVLSQYADDFLYLGCVRFVKQASNFRGQQQQLLCASASDIVQ